MARGGDPPYKRAGFSTPGAYAKARAESKRWSDNHSHGEASEYKPRMSPEAVGNYYRAFVSPVTSTKARRDRGLRGGSKYLKRRIVNDLGLMTAEEFDANYAELV